jgi:hypothetical protein
MSDPGPAGVPGVDGGADVDDLLREGEEAHGVWNPRSHRLVVATTTGLVLAGRGTDRLPYDAVVDVDRETDRSTLARTAYAGAALVAVAGGAARALDAIASTVAVLVGGLAVALLVVGVLAARRHDAVTTVRIDRATGRPVLVAFDDEAEARALAAHLEAFAGDGHVVDGDERGRTPE